MTDQQTRVDRYDDVVRVLADPRILVPQAPVGDGPFLRFRAQVSRYSNGPDHLARRKRIEQLLAELDPVRLAADARLETAARIAEQRPVESFDAETCCAKTVPVTVLGSALAFGCPGTLAELVAAIAVPYATGTVDTADADKIISTLLALAPAADPEDRVLQVQLLAQSFTATAALIVAVLTTMAATDWGRDVPGTLRQVMDVDQPVPVTKRVATEAVPINGYDVETGATMVVSLRAQPPGGPGSAPSLAFGSGPRQCPAPHHALAIAQGVVEGIQAACSPAAEARRPQGFWCVAR